MKKALGALGLGGAALVKIFATLGDDVVRVAATAGDDLVRTAATVGDDFARVGASAADEVVIYNSHALQEVGKVSDDAMRGVVGASDDLVLPTSRSFSSFADEAAIATGDDAGQHAAKLDPTIKEIGEELGQQTIETAADLLTDDDE